MNMNKILAAGLIAAVASTASFATQCGNGGFYVGANAGVAFTKLKTTAASTVTTAADIAAYRVNKSKTKFLADLFFGYDHRINDIMLGVDLIAGTMFGTRKLNIGPVAAGRTPDHDNISLKNTWNIALMPRVGYLVMPQLEIYATAGAKLAHYKLTYTPNGNVANRVVKSAKRVKFVPVVGAGVRYEITPDIFAKLEYNFEFRKGVKLPTTSPTTPVNIASAKTQSHVVKLGVGFRF